MLILRYVMNRMMLATATQAALYMATHLMGMHVLRFMSDCAYVRLCAPPATLEGFLKSWIVSNSDVCVALRNSNGLLNEVIAFTFVGLVGRCMHVAGVSKT